MIPKLKVKLKIGGTELLVQSPVIITDENTGLYKTRFHVRKKRDATRIHTLLKHASPSDVILVSSDEEKAIHRGREHQYRPVRVTTFPVQTKLQYSDEE